MEANVRFGTLADMCSAKRHVRFTPKMDICGAPADVRFGPIADIMRVLVLLARLVGDNPFVNVADVHRPFCLIHLQDDLALGAHRCFPIVGSQPKSLTE